MTTDPARASKRAESFSVAVETMFINDVVKEHARVLHEAERRKRREELLEEDASQEFNAAQFAANGPQAGTKNINKSSVSILLLRVNSCCLHTCM